MTNRTGPNRVIQQQHLDDSGCQKVSSVLSVGKLYSNDITNVQKVGTGNVLRVTIAAATVFAFSDNSDALNSETVSTSTADPFFAISLSSSGTYEIATPAKFIKASTNPSRIELIQ